MSSYVHAYLDHRFVRETFADDVLTENAHDLALGVGERFALLQDQQLGELWQIRFDARGNLSEALEGRRGIVGRFQG